jgi:hypothetical protein
MNHPKRQSGGIFTSSQGGTVWVECTQIRRFLEQSEAGPRERQPNVLKSKLAQGGPLEGSSKLRSDDTCDGQVGGWTS